ncbi:MAG: C39 family peptidase [Anaerolineaceae bacterium]|nr:C39 family peptidase [Anaerolineaceae bacterium]
MKKQSSSWVYSVFAVFLTFIFVLSCLGVTNQAVFAQDGSDGGDSSLDSSEEATQQPAGQDAQASLDLITSSQLNVISENYAEREITGLNGIEYVDSVIDGPAHPVAGYEEESTPIDVFPSTAKTLSNVPAYSWVMGCSAVSGAMVAGYFDRIGYSKMYTGSTSSGVMPLTDTVWSTWSDGYESYPNNPLIASHKGIDGRTTRGSLDDYWVKYTSTAKDPYIAGSWTQHIWGTAISDYMKTSQSAYGNTDGSTNFLNYAPGPYQAQKNTCADMATAGVAKYDGTYGRKLFYEARGYTVTDCYSQNTDNNYSGGFSFANFKSEIDSGNPVLLNLKGHTIVGLGYDTATNKVYIHDTWGNYTTSMIWGGSYNGMMLLSVSIVHLKALSTSVPDPLAPSGTVGKTKPSFQWSAINSASKYQLQVLSSSKTVLDVSVAKTKCTTTKCTYIPTINLSEGTYKWRVRAYKSSKWNAYTSLQTFTVNTVPDLISPITLKTIASPNYQWSVVPGAGKYQLQVYKGSNYLVNTEVSSSYCDSTCSFTPSVILNDTTYIWRVRAYSGSTWSAYSSVSTFGVVTQPTLISPTGWVASTTPAYKWNTVTNATQYEVMITNGTSTLLDTTYPSSVCSGTVCSVTPALTLTNGNYQWRVRAYRNSSWLTYSNFLSFSYSDQGYNFTDYFTVEPTAWKPINSTWYISNGKYKSSGTIEEFATVAHELKYSALDYNVWLGRAVDKNDSIFVLIRGDSTDLNAGGGWKNNMFFGYTNDGMFSVFKTVDNLLTPLVTWTDTSCIYAYEQNHIEVKASGSNYEFYLNGCLVAAGSDSSFSRGQIGIGFYTGSVSSPIWVDTATLSTTVTLSAASNLENPELNPIATFNPQPGVDFDPTHSPER